jgi:tellurite resistance protein TerC
MLLSSARRVIIFVAGSVVVVIGIAGLVLPIIPGLVVIPIGVAILATEFIWARRLLQRMKDGGTTIMDKFKNHTSSRKNPPPGAAPAQPEVSRPG